VSANHTEIVALRGKPQQEQVTWRQALTGEVETHDIRHVFVMAGAVPNTRWLKDCLALDGKGFIKTGSDLTREDLDASGWPLSRSPHLLETSLPGVFAVGDVRCGNLNRVASAVGEGSMAVAFVHRVLRE
jgi:thioredoxin reductase (NADPH)